MQDTKKIHINNSARQMWLNYYNDYLYEHQIITEKQWRKMRRRIDEKTRTSNA